MRKDYHMHPTVVQDPARFDAFAEAALQKGIGEVCITDHMPLSVSDAADRITRGCVGEYCRRVHELADRWAGRLTVRCGIEIDFHPDYMDEIRAVLDAGTFHYVLASSHFHVFMTDDEMRRCTRNDFAARALENLHRAVDTGLFTAAAHLDVHRCTFTQMPLIDDGYHPDRHMHLIRPLLRAIADRGMYLEINPHFAEAMGGGIEHVYPAQSILTEALALPIRFSYGSDAHVPSSVGAMLDELENHPLYGRALRRWEGA